MPTTATYPAPDNRVLRWIAEIGEDLPDEVRTRLRSAFFTSKLPLIVGAINTIIVAGVTFVLTQRLVFLVIALCDLVLLAMRVHLLRRTGSPSGPLFATGLLWAALQGATIVLVVAAHDLALSLLVLATGLAAIGGILSRNFAAPRYAMGQVLILDASFKIAFSVQYPEFLPLIAFQSVIFFLMNAGIIRQHRTMAIDAIRGELASRQQALTDPLTGLGNRRAFEQRFARRPLGARALLYLDLDGFKQVNDRWGHAAGDQLLRQVAQRLGEMTGPSGVVCRLGGDEFLVLVEGVDVSGVRALAARIVAAVAVPYDLEAGVLARVGVSVGASIDGGRAAPLATMMTEADKALYAAKASGRGTCILFDDGPRSSGKTEPPHAAAALAG